MVKGSRGSGSVGIYYWMAVTADKYELPLVVEDTAGQLAEKLGINITTVFTRYSRDSDGSRSGYRIRKVKREE